MEMAYTTMTEPRASTMLMQACLCCNNVMYMLSLCCVRDHDVCLMQCIWNDGFVLCMTGSRVRAHIKTLIGHDGAAFKQYVICFPTSTIKELMGNVTF